MIFCSSAAVLDGTLELQGYEFDSQTEHMNYSKCVFYMPCVLGQMPALHGPKKK